MRSKLNIWIGHSTTLLLLIVFGPSSQPADAQSQRARQQEVQQLKDKLQQLDQTMRDLQEEIKGLESGAQTAPAAPTQEPEVSIPAEPSATEPQTDPVPLEGEITEKLNTVDFYGFAMLDSGYDFGQIDPNWFDVVRPTKLPSFANEFAPSGNVYAGVRQSRFGVKSSTPTQFGDLKTIFEFELFGTGVDAGQTTFRLRHAYGELGQ